MSDPSREPLPAKFRQRLDDLEAALDADLLPDPAARRTVFRVVRDAERVLTDLADLGLAPEPVPGLDHTWSVAPVDRELLTHAGPATDGSLYVQGAASIRAARALGALPDQRVLDLAAAPGGKTLVLAAAMQGRGELVAVDAVKARFHRLRANLDHAGAGHVRTWLGDGRRVPRDFHQHFDRVLLDAPCSSEARIDPATPKTFANWSLGKVRDMARKQWGLLGTALRCLAPGGEVVYSTCSFAPEENEATLAAWLTVDDSDDRAAELLPLDLGEGVTTRPGLERFGRKRWPEQLHLARRIVPDALHEGLFVARLRRR